MTDLTLPFHPRTGLQAIGLRRNGVPIWPVLGGAEDDDVIVSDADDDAADAGIGDDSDDDSGDGDAGAPDDGKDDDSDDKPLGPKGEKALQAEKDRRREADRLRRQAARERDEALAELERLRKAAEQKPADGDTAADKGPDLDAIRKEAEEQAKAAVKAEVLRDRVSDKIEVIAAKRAQDPDVVRTLLLAGNEIADFLDGDKIDAEAIKEALDELLEKKPYLAVAAQSAKRFQGSGDGGARKGPQKPAQLTQDDLRRMSPEQIVQAQDEGRFDDLMGLTR
ncbi:hypothetical protein FXF51_06100 [Nonomuraea sp. PA05]|uniref:hypothetical protein n=1 Tax=Nonomuraea sp. PA05 TaxID=2604466 RepID=UPI0011DC0318|nr:hypothetical protein [Nonomuraea sp. PA05]TYB69732.1 hypothetical protein FXF51_06100 [Nonomuraea sp. PA05]